MHLGSDIFEFYDFFSGKKKLGQICIEPMWASSKIKVAKNILKHILVLEFLKYDEILEMGKFLSVATIKCPSKGPSNRTNARIPQ